MSEFIANVDFKCIEKDCEETIKFNVMGLVSQNGIVACPNCHHQYKFDESFIDKLKKLRKILIAVQEGKDIIGSSSVAVATPAGEVKVPYYLLMTRLNSILSLELEEKTVDFCFRIEPINGSFR